MGSDAKISEIKEMVMKGKAKNVKTLVEECVAEGYDVNRLLNEGLLEGMQEIGEKFKKDEVYVPEVLVAARAMNMGLAVLEPFLTGGDYKPIGKAVIGTVHGDMHDIGKNLVAMMLKGSGIEVYDVGVDATAEQFVEKAKEVGAHLICMSSLLTTTMPYMKNVVDELKEMGVRDQYIVMVGGAPVNQNFAEQIGADYYTPDAATAATVAKQALLEQK